jgi:hypothetical protein
MPTFSRRFHKKVLALGLSFAVQVAAAETTLFLGSSETPPAAAARHRQGGLPEDTRATLDALHQEVQLLRKQLDEEREPSACTTSTHVLFHPTFLQ